MPAQACAPGRAAPAWIRRTLRSAAENALEVLFPPLCLHCDGPRGRSSVWLCQECLSTLMNNAVERPHCPRCAVNSEQHECTCDLVWDYPFSRIHALFDYGDLVRTIAHAVKYRGMSRLIQDAGRRYGGTVPAEFWSDVDCVVPVPLHTLRWMRRGYNQADRFARGLLESLDSHAPSYEPKALRRRRHTRTQTKLDRDQRAANLAQAFAVREEMVPAVAGKCVVLVDDIVTTGATTGACAEALVAGGAREVRVLALARD